jgi:hypothetical protein
MNVKCQNDHMKSVHQTEIKTLEAAPNTGPIQDAVGSSPPSFLRVRRVCEINESVGPSLPGMEHGAPTLEQGVPSHGQSLPLTGKQYTPMVQFHPANPVMGHHLAVALGLSLPALPQVVSATGQSVTSIGQGVSSVRQYRPANPVMGPAMGHHPPGALALSLPAVRQVVSAIQVVSATGQSVPSIGQGVSSGTGFTK